MSQLYKCDWKAGFAMDPSQKQRVGYLVHFEGLNMGDYLHQDVEVFTPFNHSDAPSYSEMQLDKSTGKVTCVGVIDKFSFGGGVGHPLCISAYISAQNAEVISAKMKSTIDTSVVKKLGWWLCNFDEENKVWYEEAFPIDPVTVSGQINAPGGSDLQLKVASEPTKISDTIDINVYNFYFELIPAANSTFAFHFATSSKTKFVRNWGMKIGTNAASAVG